MKNGKKIFILVETFLGLMVFVLVMFMFLEKNEKKQEKIDFPYCKFSPISGNLFLTGCSNS